MGSKNSIIERIGESGLLLPELITRGLAANDRLKYYLTLLHTAHAYADAPRSPAPSLRVEREASGVADPSLDQVVETSSMVGITALHIPAAGAIVEHIFEALREMLQPLQVASTSHQEIAGRLEVYKRRLDDLAVRTPPCHDDQLTVAAVTALTALSVNGHDTVNQLATDLQWELDRMRARVAMEAIDGACVYDITTEDRGLVKAFMKGINETARLKFERPGLETIATRDGDRLSIQNDLDSTDAHVLVVHVTSLVVTVTYADVFRPRIQFLQELMRSYDVKWTATPPIAGADYEMSVGRYTAESLQSLERFLTFLGSRLVFLIDWQRARKRLARVIRKSDAVDLLKWAADNNVGHRGFLQAGGVGLIDTAVERAAPRQIRLGRRLDEWLGRDAARLFLMSVLSTTSSALSARRSQSLIEDEVEAELIRHVQTTDPHLLKGVAEHARVLSAVAERVRDTIGHVKAGGAGTETARTAELARTWSSRADQIAVRSYRSSNGASSDRDLRRLINEADVAVDALEGTAFLLTLLPDSPDPKTLSLLDELAELVEGAGREYVHCLEEGRDLSAASARMDVETFLIAIDRLFELGRQATSVKRVLTERLVRTRGDFHDLYVIANMADRFEHATSALTRCGVMLREQVLNANSSR